MHLHQCRHERPDGVAVDHVTETIQRACEARPLLVWWRHRSTFVSWASSRACRWLAALFRQKGWDAVAQGIPLLSTEGSALNSFDPPCCRPDRLVGWFAPKLSHWLEPKGILSLHHLCPNSNAAAVSHRSCPVTSFLVSLFISQGNSVAPQGIFKTHLQIELTIFFQPMS